MPSQRTMLDLVDHIYGAVEDQARWPSFLEDLAGTLRVSATNLFMQDLHQPRGNAFATFATDPSFTRSYAEYYGKINVFLIKGQKLLRSGNVSFSSELCPDHEARRSEFFNDWVLPQGQQHGLLGTIYNQNSLVGNIGAIRAPGAKPFTPADKRLLQTLMPHLQRAVRLRRRIADLETLETRTADALDHWTTAVFLVDFDTRVILANRTAVDLLGQRDGLLVERGILKTARSRDTVMLHRLIREAVATTIDRNDHASGAMLIERISGKCPLQIFVTPSVREDIFFGTRGSALVFVGDPETQRTETDVLRTLYRLTPAEAVITSLLAEGKSVKEIAERTFVRENTVRIHLKKIFDKTGAKRQAELVKIVLPGPATLRAG